MPADVPDATNRRHRIFGTSHGAADLHSATQILTYVVFVRLLNDASGTMPTTRDPDNGVDQVSQRGFQPFLQGLAKTIRKNKNKKHIELTGYESAQRKRFLRSEAEDGS